MDSADFNQDGRSDIVATQTLGQSHFYLGQVEKRGIRVVIDTEVGLAKRLGTALHLIYSDGTFSPSRYLHSGDGVLSQCSTEAVLGFNEWPSSIQVIWANGDKQMISVQPGIYEYIIR